MILAVAGIEVARRDHTLKNRIARPRRDVVLKLRVPITIGADSERQHQSLKRPPLVLEVRTGQPYVRRSPRVSRGRRVGITDSDLAEIRQRARVGSEAEETVLERRCPCIAAVVHQLSAGLQQVLANETIDRTNDLVSQSETVRIAHG